MTRVVFRSHIYGAMRRQLRGVHQDFGPGSVDLCGDAVHRVNIAADVGRAGDRHQAHPSSVFVQKMVQMGFVQCTLFVDVHVLCPCDVTPGQIIGVMLHQRGQNHVLWRQW